MEDFVAIMFFVLFFSLILFLLLSKEATTRNKHTKSHNQACKADFSGWVIFLDGSNCCRDGDTASLNDLHNVISCIKSKHKGSSLRVVCDANLRYKFNPGESKRFVELVNRGMIRESHGEKADDVILRETKALKKSFVVSNDNFAEHDRLDVPILKFRLENERVRFYPSFFIQKSSLLVGSSERIISVERYVNKVNRKYK